jgi:hypothetical protein
MTLEHLLLCIFAGLAIGFFGGLLWYRKVVDRARSAEVEAKLTLNHAKYEYGQLKQGLAHRLDHFLGEK